VREVYIAKLYIIKITAPPKRMANADSVWLLRCPLGGK